MKLRSPWSHWLLALSLAALVPAETAGQQPSARAFLDQSTVGVNQVFTLSLEVSDVQRLDSDPALPAGITDFAQYLGSGSQTSMQMSGGRTAVSITVEYRFLAQREGTFEIPAISVQAGGQNLSTEPLEVTVTAAPPSNSGRAQQGTGVSPEDVFLVASVDKTRVFENEALIVEYRIFTRVNIESYTLLSPPSVEGFWVEEIPMADGPVVEQVTRNGIEYTSAVLRRAALFPTGAGSRTIEPSNVEARVRIQRRGGVLDDFFGSRLFGSVVPVDVSSAPVDIDVQALPAENRPEGFTGVVGSLDVRASVDRTELEANDAVTLTVRVDGEGNLRGLGPPDLGLDADFEVFDPEISENISRAGGVVRGSKTFEYVLIPRAPGERTIPAIELAYFDPGLAAYAVSTAPAILLDVTGDVPTGVGATLRGGVETLREDIRFIRLGSPLLRRSGGGIQQSPTFWMIMFLPFVAVAGAMGLRTHWNRLEGDVAYARGRRATKVAKKRLAAARAMVQDGESPAFYSEVSRALQGFLADKLNLSEAGLMSSSVARSLADRGVSEPVSQEYLACLEHCDRQRFAPGPSDAEARGDFMNRVERSMSALGEALS